MMTPEAFQQISTLAEAGDAMAMYDLGFAYESGNGVDQDWAEAITWYLKSAEAANPLAMFALATAYSTGDGVDKSPQEASIWYHKAAEQAAAIGDPDVIFYLLFCHEHGEGVNINPADGSWQLPIPLL